MGEVDLAPLISTGGKKTMQYVILVGCQNQCIDRQPHAAGNVARKYISKVTRWHGNLESLRQSELHIS